MCCVVYVVDGLCVCGVALGIVWRDCCVWLMLYDVCVVGDWLQLLDVVGGCWLLVVVGC